MDEFLLRYFSLLLRRTASIESVVGKIDDCMTSSNAMILSEVFCSGYMVVNSEYAESDKSSAVVDFKLMFF